MIRILVVVLVLGCSSRDRDPDPASLPVFALPPAPVAVAEKHVTLQVAPPRAGDVTMVTRTSTTHGVAIRFDQPHTIDLTERWVLEIETLVVEDRIVTSARVKLTEKSLEFRREGVPARKPSVLVGEVYFADWKNRGIVLRRADGHAPSDAERTELLAVLRGELGVPDILGATLASRPLDSGTVVMLPESELAASLGDGVALVDARAWLVDVRGDHAAVAIELRGTTDHGQQRFESRELLDWSISGGRVVAITDVATFHGTLEGQAVSNRIEGTVSFSTTNVAP